MLVFPKTRYNKLICSLRLDLAFGMKYILRLGEAGVSQYIEMSATSLKTTDVYYSGLG